MIFVAAAGAVVAIVLLVLLRRERAHVAELSGQVDALAAERDGARADAATAREAASLAQRERDDALERIQRARRDAAEVATRLQEAVAAGAAAERQGEEAREQATVLRRELDAAHRELDAARTELARRPPAGGPPVAELLWHLTLDRVERLWRTSIAVHPEEPSPLRATDEPLRVALEVLADAAHEESGADITIEWSAQQGPVPETRAVLAAAVVEALIAGLAKADAHIAIAVRPSADGVEIVVDGHADGGAGLVPEALATGAGRYLVA